MHRKSGNSLSQICTWLGNTAPSCRREGTVKFLLFYSPRAAVAAVSGLGKEAGLRQSWKSQCELRHSEPPQKPPADTCSGVFGDRTLTWKPTTTKGKLYKVLCLWNQGHTLFRNHYSIITSSITHEMLSKPQHRTGFPSVLPHENKLCPYFIHTIYGQHHTDTADSQPGGPKNTKQSRHARITLDFFFIWGWKGICYQSIPDILCEGRG